MNPKKLTLTLDDEGINYAETTFRLTLEEIDSTYKFDDWIPDFSEKQYEKFKELAASSLIPRFKLIVKDYNDSAKLFKNIKILKELEIFN